jgi:hypothetical protein
VRTKEKMLGELKMVSLYYGKEESTMQKKYMVQHMRSIKRECQAVTSAKFVVVKIAFVMTTTIRL